MDNEEIIRTLKKYPGLNEVEVLVHRIGAYWGTSRIEIRIWDRGRAETMPFVATAEIEHGEDGEKRSTECANPESTVELALDALAAKLEKYRPK